MRRIDALCLGLLIGCGPDVAADSSGASETSGEAPGSTSTQPPVSTTGTSVDPTADGTTSSTSGAASSEDDASTNAGTGTDTSATEGGESSSGTGLELIDCYVPDDYATIQGAIDDPACSRIFVAEGEYEENLTIDRDVEVFGLDGGVDLSGDPSARLVTVVDGIVTIEHFHLDAYDPGEGAIANDGDLTLRSVSGQATKLGGEGAFVRSTGPLTLDLCYFGGLLHPDPMVAGPQVLSGAGIYIEGAPLIMVDSTVDLAEIELSDAGGTARGVAIAAVDADVSLSGSDCDGVIDGPGWGADTLALGQAIYVEGGSLTLEDSIVADLGLVVDVDRSFGGGIHLVDADLSVLDSAIWGSLGGEAAAARGGSIFVDASTDVSIELVRTALAGWVRQEQDAPPPFEQATGGAIAIVATSGAAVDLAVTNVYARPRLTTTSLPGAGGFLYAEATAGATIDVTVSSSTLDTHTVGATGGLFAATADALSTVDIEVKNSILWEGEDALDCSLDGATVQSNGYNMWSEGTTCDAIADGDFVAVDPELVSGPVIAPTSPAVDAGDPTGCTDAAGAVLTDDYSGDPRPNGLACDIGAVEL